MERIYAKDVQGIINEIFCKSTKFYKNCTKSIEKERIVCYK